MHSHYQLQTSHLQGSHALRLINHCECLGCTRHGASNAPKFIASDYLAGCLTMRDSSGLARPHSVSELDEDEVAEPLSSESDDALPRLLSCGKHFRHLFAQGSSPPVKLAPP